MQLYRKQIRTLEQTYGTEYLVASNVSGMVSHELVIVHVSLINILMEAEEISKVSKRHKKL